MIFFDTNLFLYAASGASDDAPRRGIAHQLIASTDFGISVQVMQEFIDAALRKKRLGIDAAEVEEMIELMSGYPTATTSVASVRHALTLRNRYDIRYWDAAIVTAAQELGCRTLYTEDLNHEQDYDGVRVINPFL